MTLQNRLQHEFVEGMPENIEDGLIYVSILYGTAIHKCCCGCGNEVVTPITPADWRLIYNGESLSLRPSIGNWRFKCKSHYWITEGKVDWIEDNSTVSSNSARAEDEKSDTKGVVANFLKKILRFISR